MRLGLAVALIWAAVCAAAEPAKLVLSSRLNLENGLRGFGGLSGIAMSPDGMRAHVINDQGQIFSVAFERNESGALTDFVLQTSKILNFYGPRNRPDTEGLALAPDGGVWVSIENPMVVVHYPAKKYWPDKEIPFPEPFRFSTNRGLEALAVDDDGQLVTLTETVPWGRDGFPIYRLEDSNWVEIGEVPARAGFHMVGADFGPNGALYLLERAFSPLGFRAQIRRFFPSDPSRPPEVLFVSDVNQFDNLEGISAWRDRQGITRVVVVSDDNFQRFQRSELAEFILIE